MTIVVRIIQGLLILAGLVACVVAVVLAGEAHDDVDARCYMVTVSNSNDKAPDPGCATVGVFQTKAIAGAAVGFSGIGLMIGAAAMGSMARPAGPKAPKPAPYAYGPPPGGPYPPQGGPHTGQQPPVQQFGPPPSA
ncbi:hypothetical protein ACFQV2_01715 [Actinokineospora soli]|uniref:Uncharacterized protein n=1 Tax=Actinokineospora soli TaxID=1048753 RepID=A0ABW2TI96_9PSEU